MDVTENDIQKEWKNKRQNSRMTRRSRQRQKHYRENDRYSMNDIMNERKIEHPPLLPLTYNNLHPLQKSEICERASPRGAVTERHKITLQNFLIHRSWPVEWSPPPPSGMLDPCQSSSNNWKLISSAITWLHLKKNKKQPSLSFFSFP